MSISRKFYLSRERSPSKRQKINVYVMFALHLNLDCIPLLLKKLLTELAFISLKQS